MNGKVFWLSITAVVASFICGFLLANALNRTELNALRAERDGGLKNSSTNAKQNESELTLSDEEVREKIAEADRNPANYAFQKNLGLALYRYAAMRQDSKMLAEVGRLLSRAYENNPQDRDVAITLGNVYFDIGYFQKDNSQFQKARGFYQKALEQKQDDADVRTDLGLTYFLIDPPENEQAIIELQKSLQINPKHEKTLEVLTQIMISQNKIAEAEKLIGKLKEANPNNRTIPGLDSQVLKLKNNS